MAAKSFHIDTPDNNSETKFDFTEENYKRVDSVRTIYHGNE